MQSSGENLVSWHCHVSCPYFITVNQYVHVCVMERDKHSFFCSAQSFFMFCHEFSFVFIDFFFQPEKLDL